jgi:hypothetical protein
MPNRKWLHNDVHIQVRITNRTPIRIDNHIYLQIVKLQIFFDLSTRSTPNCGILQLRSSIITFEPKFAKMNRNETGNPNWMKIADFKIERYRFIFERFLIVFQDCQTNFETVGEIERSCHVLRHYKPVKCIEMYWNVFRMIILFRK